MDVERAAPHLGFHEVLQCQVLGEHYHVPDGCLARSTVTERDDHGQLATEKVTNIERNPLMSLTEQPTGSGITP